MSQPLPFDENNFDKNVVLQEILYTPDDSDIGCFLEVDLTYLDIIKEKTKHFSIAPENKKNYS